MDDADGYTLLDDNFDTILFDLVREGIGWWMMVQVQMLAATAEDDRMRAKQEDD
jgi:hypothetical protein